MPSDFKTQAQTLEGTLGEFLDYITGASVRKQDAARGLPPYEEASLPTEKNIEGWIPEMIQNYRNIANQFPQLPHELVKNFAYLQTRYPRLLGATDWQFSTRLANKAGQEIAGSYTPSQQISRVAFKPGGETWHEGSYIDPIIHGAKRARAYRGDPYVNLNSTFDPNPYGSVRVRLGSQKPIPGQNEFSMKNFYDPSSSAFRGYHEFLNDLGDLTQKLAPQKRLPFSSDLDMILKGQMPNPYER